MKTYNYIYLIRNLINNKIYIGKHSTDNLQDGYMGSGIAINNAYKKYGQENFRKTLLCLCDEDDLNEMEKLYIQVYGSTDRNIGYNLTFGGDGVIPTEEVKRKISTSKKGKPSPNKGKSCSAETRRKLSESHKGKTPSNKGKHHSDEARRKMSESRKGKPLKKFQWKTPDGEIVEMDKANAKKNHPDWILIEE